MARDLVDGELRSRHFNSFLTYCGTGTVAVDPAFENDRERLLAESQKIVDSPQGWRPAFIIIDKFRPSRLAIRQGKPRFNIS
jgi:hypothetical protein